MGANKTINPVQAARKRQPAEKLKQYAKMAFVKVHDQWHKNGNIQEHGIGIQSFYRPEH